MSAQPVRSPAARDQAVRLDTLAAWIAAYTPDPLDALGDQLVTQVRLLGALSPTLRRSLAGVTLAVTRWGEPYLLVEAGDGRTAQLFPTQ